MKNLKRAKKHIFRGKIAYFSYKKLTTFDFNDFTDYIMDFTAEIQRLQKLSCIALSPEQEQKLGSQLERIITFLGQLPNTEVQSPKSKVQSQKLTLRTIKGVQEDKNREKLMKNVKHPIVNNSIVIKSVLN